MTCKVIPVLIILSCLFVGSALAQFDQGDPDSLALEVSVPNAGVTDGLVTAELWAFNDVDDLLGVSVGFRWENDNLHLDSVISEQSNWDMSFLYNNNLFQDNLQKVMLFASFSLSPAKSLPASPERKKLATWYFTLSSWNAGDQILIDTSEYMAGAAMIFGGTTGESYIPVWAGGDSPLVFTAVIVYQPQSWHVSLAGDDVTGTGSANDPFATLAKAFDSAQDFDTIMVHPGHYTGVGNRNLDLDGRNLIIMSTDGPTATILDGGGSSSVFFISGQTYTEPVIKGFTLQNGYAAAGGLIVCYGASPLIKECVFTDGHANYGGAIFFNGNQSSASPSAPTEAAINPVIENCTFVGNVAQVGSAIYYQYNSLTLSVRNSIFYGNTADIRSPVDNNGSNVGGAVATMFATDIYGNSPGDWIGSIEAQLSMNANLNEDPLFCTEGFDDVSISANSPCAPENNQFRQLIGAVGVACGEPGGGGDDVVYPTNEWISIYCPGGIIVEGEPLGPNQYIRAYDPDGVLCGLGQTNEMGQLPLFSIYRDDIYSERDEGAEPGDMITFAIGGQEAQAVPGLHWTANGDVSPVCEFKLERCLGIRLNQGWNLISWNVWYTDEITEALSDVMDCVDVVLGFEQGGLTFDPDLPQFSSLSQVDFYHGYWVRMNCAATLSICGTPMESILVDTLPAIPVETGWNLLSFWPNEPVVTEAAFAQALQMEVLEVAIGFDQGAQVWLPGQAQFSTLTELKPGFGYWARMSQGFDFMWGGGFIDFTLPIDFHNGGVDLLNNPSAISESKVKTANTWVSVYGADLVLDNEALKEGTVVTFHTDNGELRGQGLYQNGLLAFTPVYGPDKADNPLVLAPVASEQFIIRVDGNQVKQRLEWTANGDRIRLDRLTSDSNGSLPTEYSLSQNYPNPFNPVTTIGFSLPSNQHVKLTILNVLGQNVITLTDADLPAGEHQVVWDARDANGNLTASGVYFYRLESSEFTMTKKMILTK